MGVGSKAILSGAEKAIPLMSNQQLMEIVDRSTEEERIFLRAYLDHVARRDAPEHQAELARRIDHGTYYTLEEVEAVHRKLEAEGR